MLLGLPMAGVALGPRLGPMQGALQVPVFRGCSPRAPVKFLPAPKQASLAPA